MIDDATGKRFMAHNSDIASSPVQHGFAVLTQGERVEYCLLRDVVGKWKCDAVTGHGGGLVSPDQIPIDMSINSGYRQQVQRTSQDLCDRLDDSPADVARRWSRKADVGKGKGRRWRPGMNAAMGA